MGKPCCRRDCGMLIYCVAGIIANWETVKAWFTLLWENPSAAIEQFVSFLQSKLSEGITWAQEKWEALREVLSHPIDAVVNFIKGGDSAASAAAGVDISANALGGIYKQGAFLTTFAERSAEAAIPIDGSARAVSLWKQTGAMLGLLPEQATSMAMTQAPSPMQSSTVAAMPPPSGGVNITFNPTIHIDGAADAGVVEQLRAELERQKQELIAMFPTLIKRQDAHERRISYA